MSFKRVAVLAFPDCQVLDVTAPLQVFASANNHLGMEVYQPGILAQQPGPLQTNSGMQLLPRWTLDVVSEDEERLHTLLVAGGSGIYQQLENQRLVQWLQRQASSVARLGSVCTGAFLLAEAGLIQGKRVATHWHSAAALARRYPGVQVDDDAIWLKEQGVYSSAGVTAGMDLALAMLEEDFGADLAMSVARELVVFRQRPGGQQQYSEPRAICQDLPKPVQRVVDWVQKSPASDLRLDCLAGIASVSPRHLSRLFRQTLGQTPAQYVENVRLERARYWLEQGEASIDHIAQRCGFGSVDSLRRVFVRQLGVTPADYRKCFG